MRSVLPVLCIALLCASGCSRDESATPASSAPSAPAVADAAAPAPATSGTLTDPASGAVIGSSRFQYCDREEEDGALEIGWSFLARSCWGRGYNAEFKRLMLAHAFAHVERVVFRVGADNVISRKAMANIGGRLTGATYVEERAGRPVEHVVFEITRASFAAGPLMH